MRVEREVLREAVREAGLFEKKRRYRHAYRVTLANEHPGPERVEITEQLPVSALADVTVGLDAATGGPALDAANGFVTWKLALAPAELRSVDLAFHVDLPLRYSTGKP